MILLEADSVLFFSQKDEASFFRNLNEISFVKKVSGEGLRINIVCDEKDVDLENFLSIYAVFRRYEVSCIQLQLLLSNMNNDDKNRLSEPSMVWHADIFG